MICIDIDECQENPAFANLENGFCTNIEGSYILKCNEGYDLDEGLVICRQIVVETEDEEEEEEEYEDEYDEYDLEMGSGDEDDFSSNLQIFAGLDDDDEEEGHEKEEGQEEEVNVEEQENEPEVENFCQTKYKFMRHGTCQFDGQQATITCDPGYIFDQLLDRCTDLNECLNYPNFTNGRCFNNGGGFELVCDYGYQLVENVCVDIDECQLHYSVFQHGQCVNSEGSFDLYCNDGYVLTRNKKCRKDIDIKEKLREF